MILLTLTYSFYHKNVKILYFEKIREKVLKFAFSYFILQS